ncbi:MAG: GTPase [Isosphaeraceae bacterium]
MVRNWRSWVLLILLVGPFAAYMSLGAYWLMQHGWALYAFMAWVASGTLLYFLANKWTKTRRQVLPPIDWDSPRTYSPHDRKAWDLVKEEADQGDAIAMDVLSGFDVYIDTGRRLANRLAAHYHPLSTDPIEHVPVVEIMTALELAAEDLEALCREIPGGDLVTYAHWKRAVQATGYLTKANEIYGYLLPLFQPMSGLVRLGAQKLMVQPSWRNVQQNVMRWFYRAFVNRLGHHLIELYSGRLAIGAGAYRRLARKGMRGVAQIEGGPGPLVIAVAGAKDVGKTTLIAALEQARAADLGVVRARLGAAGFDPDLAGLLMTAELVEIDSYTAHVEDETARDRHTRRDAVEDAADADLLLLVVSAQSLESTADAKFVDAWTHWYDTHLDLEPPPVLAVVTGADPGGIPGIGRALAEAARAALPAVVTAVVPVGLGTEPPAGVSDPLLPELALLLHRAERSAVMRHFHRLSARSKTRRVLNQVGRQGRRLFSGLRSAQSARRTGTKSSP